MHVIDCKGKENQKQCICFREKHLVLMVSDKIHVIPRNSKREYCRPFFSIIFLIKGPIRTYNIYKRDLRQFKVNQIHIREASRNITTLHFLMTLFKGCPTCKKPSIHIVMICMSVCECITHLLS